MSQIEPVLVVDNILSCEDKVKYAVFSGGQSVTTQQFAATSSTNSQMVFTVQVPSTNVVMDRRLMVRYTLQVAGTTNTVNAGQRPFQYGSGGTVVLAPLPLNQSITNVSVQINNTTVSQTTQQILDPLLRCLEKETLAEYSGFCPTKLDNLSPQNSATTGYTSSAWQTYANALDTYCPPRGAFPCRIISNDALAEAGAGPWTVQFDICEPLCVSPFVFGDDSASASGIYGVSQININLSLDSTFSRAIRTIAGVTGTYGATAITAVQYIQPQIECRFLTPPASALLPMTNIVPYNSIVNYATNGTAGVAANYSTQNSIVSNNIQLNAVPDKLFCFVRDAQQNLTSLVPDCYGTITKVSILWNNNSGLLAGATPQTLWRMSREAGNLESWLEFSGLASIQAVSAVPGAANPASVGTVGSVLVLDFGKHIQLQENYYAPGSLGAFNFQIQVTYSNYTGADFAAPVLNCAFMSSGVFATTNGQSAAYIGVLNKEEVLKAMEQEPTSQHTLERLVGGRKGPGLFHGLKTMANRAFRFAKHHPEAIGHLKQAIASAHPKAAHAVNALGMLGLGMDGGASSGGARKHRLHHRVL